MKRILALCLAIAASAFAADVAGEWTATAEGPNGAMQRTFTFKVDGSKLTGETVSSFLGKSEIKEGKIDGDNITFVIEAKFQDTDMKLNYKGKVTGKDEIKFTVEGTGQTIEWLAKRSK